MTRKLLSVRWATLNESPSEKEGKCEACTPVDKMEEYPQ